MLETKQLPTPEKRGSIAVIHGGIPSRPVADTLELTDEKRRAMKNAIPALKNLIKCFEILIDEN